MRNLDYDVNMSMNICKPHLNGQVQCCHFFPIEEVYFHVAVDQQSKQKFRSVSLLLSGDDGMDRSIAGDLVMSVDIQPNPYSGNQYLCR